MSGPSGNHGNWVMSQRTMRQAGLLRVFEFFSPAVRYGENSGDPMHAEPHFRTASHYQNFG
jgi:hypothetical protein